MITYVGRKRPVASDLDDLNYDFSIKLPFRGLNLAPDSAVSKSNSVHLSINGYFDEFLRIIIQKSCDILCEIRQFYFGDDAINVNQTAEYIALLSDINFFYGIDKTVKLHASKSKSKTFYARFVFDRNKSGSCAIELIIELLILCLYFCIRTSNLGFPSTPN